MRGGFWRIAAATAAWACTVISPAQTPAPVSGTATIDFIRLSNPVPSVPLRYAGVVAGSETVTLNGRILARGTDYNLDAAAGMLYLFRAQKKGDSLTVAYRYDSSKATVGVAGALAGLKLDLLPGSLSMSIGLGAAQRLDDGNVMSTNFLGFNNRFSFGGSNLSGLYMMSDDTKVDSTSAFEYQAPTAAAKSGRKALIAQSLNSKMMGGLFHLSYQDVDKDFNGFGGLAAQGVDAATAGQLQKEKGLTRFGFGFDSLNLGGLKLSNNMRQVRDGDNNIEWRSYAVQNGGLTLNFSSQKIDRNFTRFNDLAEADRAQLQREQGLARQNFSGGLKTGLGLFSFDSRSILQDADAIQRSTFGFDSGKFTLNGGRQDISQGFNRFGSLNDPETGQWSREAGLSRNWMSFAMKGKPNTANPLAFSNSHIETVHGDAFSAQSLNLNQRGWSFDHLTLSADAGFNYLGSLAPDEMAAHIRTIGSMYQPGYNMQGQDPGAFIRGAGLSRAFDRIKFAPGKGLEFSAESLRLGGMRDSGSVNAYSLGFGQTKLNFRSEMLGKDFSEIGNLLDIEKQKLGYIAGISRQDLGFSTAFGKNRNLSFGSLLASADTGGLARRSFAYNDPRLQLSATTRSVDKDFWQAGALLDPEAGLFNSIRGLNERDLRGRWQVNNRLSLEAVDLGRNALDGSHQDWVRSALVGYGLDSKTSLEWFHLSQGSDGLNGLLLDDRMDRYSLIRDFGKLGKLALVNEKEWFTGSNATPDRDKKTFTYETKLNNRTSIQTQKIRTSWANGDTEDVNTQTLNAQLLKNAGLSITDVHTDRTGDNRDQVARNYGFWYDMGGGVQLKYGYVRSLYGQGMGQNTLQSQFTITQGRLRDINIGGAYNVNSWDDQHTQANSNIALSSAKGLRFGPFKNLNFNLSSSTAADYSNWQVENRLASFTANYGKALMGYEYKSQLDPGTGFRAIDRSVLWDSDPSAKADIRLNGAFKHRTLSNGHEVNIRNFNLSAKLGSWLTLTNSLLTNPEQQRGDLPLGSMTQGLRQNRWKLDYSKGPSTVISGTYDEMINSDIHSVTRLGGVTFTFNANSGSPLSLFYGQETTSQGNQRTSLSRYWLKYDMRPSARQVFSMFFGNVTYADGLSEAGKANNWTIRLDWGQKF